MLASLLTLAVLLGVPAAVAQLAAANSVSNRHGAINALIAGHAASPVLRAIRTGKKARFQVDRTSAPSGSSAAPFANRSRYRVLIVDGDNMTPRQMARHRAIRRFADTGRWVLALDLRPGHFRRAIRRMTGFKAISRARVFMFRRIFANGSPEVQMVAAPRLLPEGAGHLSRRRRRRLAQREARRLGTLLRRTVRTDAGNLGERPATQSSVEGSGVPPELQHVTWSYTEAGSVPPPNGYWTRSRHPWFGSAIHRDGVPAPGHQEATWVFTHTFDVYLDNGEGKPQGNEQIVTYNLDGEFSPKEPKSDFFQMYNGFWVGLNKHPGVDLERAWWTGAVGVSVEPSSATNAKLVWLGNRPATPDEKTQYTSGEEFEVGFSASNEGAGVSGTYKVSNEKTQTIPDWGVESTTAGNSLDWLFSSRTCDIRSHHYDANDCFDIGFGKDAHPNLPSPLSLGQVQVHASGRWRTKGVLGPGNGSLSFNLATPVTLADTYCNAGAWPLSEFACVPFGRRLKTSVISPLAKTQPFSFDASAVVPIPVESVKLSPNPAKCSNGHCQVVTGTVTLKRPAAMDLSVVIYSDSENAVVGGPSGRGSQRIISIAKGSRTGTFKVQTNDNRLSPGRHTTASITAFYAEPTTEPLRIEAKR